MKKKRGQVSSEYLIIMGFITFVVVGIMGIAFFYASNIRDGLTSLQVGSFSDKIISSSESVFYAGAPSRNTISVYIPKEVLSMEIIDNSLVVSFQTSSGISKSAFSSNVPITGDLTVSSGYKKILVVAEETQVKLSDV